MKRLLAEADGFYQSGQYDKAMKRYDQVLTLDPYNTAARRGQERIDNTKYQYGERSVQRDACPASLESRGSLATTRQKIRCCWSGG